MSADARRSPPPPPSARRRPMYVSSAQARRDHTTAPRPSPRPTTTTRPSARASCRASCAVRSPGCGCSTACRSPTWSPTRAAAAGVDPLLLPRPRLDRRAGRRARSASARSPAPTARSSRRSTRRSATRSTRQSGAVRLPGGEAAASRAGAARSPASCCARARCRAGPGCTCAPTASELGEDDDDDRSPSRTRDRLKLLRLERLAPAVLLVLFDGVPAVVHVEEPRQGIQFGVRLRAGRRAQRCQGREVPLRDAQRPASRRRPDAADAGAVPPRRAGVIDMRQLRDRIAQCPPPRRTTCGGLGRRRRVRAARCCGSRTGRCSATRRRARRTADRLDVFQPTVSASRRPQLHRSQLRGALDAVISPFEPDGPRADGEPSRAALDRGRPARRRRRRDRDLGRGPGPRAPAARAGRRAGARRRRRRRRADGAAAARRSTAPDGQGRRAARDAVRRRRRRAPPGVHLHWAMPDALLRGTLADDGPAQPARACPPCPTAGSCCACSPRGRDRARRCAAGCSRPTRARRGRPRRRGRPSAAAVTPAGATVAPAELTGTAGGVADLGRRLRRGDQPVRLPRPARRPGDARAQRRRGRPAPPTWSPAGGRPRASTRSTARRRARACTTRLRRPRLGAGRRPSRAATSVDAARSVQRRAARQPRPSRRSARYSPAQDAAAQRGAGRRPPSTSLGAKRSAVPPRPSVFADEAISVSAAEPALAARRRCCTARLRRAAGTDRADGRQPAGADERRRRARRATTTTSPPALASLGPRLDGPARAARAERLLAAFTGQLLDRVGTPDGARRHRGARARRRLRGSRPGARADRSACRRGAPGGRSAGPAARPRGRGRRAGLGRRCKADRRSPPVARKSQRPARALIAGRPSVRGGHRAPTGGTRPETGPRTEPREVARPAPRFHFPLEPMVAVRGAARSLRHGGDGRVSPDGLLHCRWPLAGRRASYQRLIDGADVLPSLGNGAVPAEVLLARAGGGAALPVPVAVAGRASRPPGAAWTRLRRPRRLAAEAALRFGADATYDGRTVAFRRRRRAAGALGVVRRAGRRARRRPAAPLLAARGRRPDPVGVTAWSQPWVPLWLEWEVEIDLADRARRLDARRRRPRAGRTAPRPALATRTLRGRSAAHDRRRHARWPPRCAAGWRPRTRATRRTPARPTRRPRRRWPRSPTRSSSSTSSPPRSTASASSCSASPYDRRAAARPRRRRDARPAGAGRRAAAAAAPARCGHAGAPGRRLRPHARPARSRPRRGAGARRGRRGRRGSLRLRPAAHAAGALALPPRRRRRRRRRAAAEARVDQVDPAQQVNPVAGFLLPDHIDEALEVFDVAGQPLGQLMHEPIGGGVVWEIAPGRPGPPDAGPLLRPRPAAQLPSGWLAAGLRRRRRAGARRAAGRAGRRVGARRRCCARSTPRCGPSTRSRALGSEHIAGLVGRPIAVVRAQLSLDVCSPTTSTSPTPVRAAERAARELALAAERSRSGSAS